MNRASMSGSSKKSPCRLGSRKGVQEKELGYNKEYGGRAAKKFKNANDRF